MELRELPWTAKPIAVDYKSIEVYRNVTGGKQIIQVFEDTFMESVENFGITDTINWYIFIMQQ